MRHTSQKLQANERTALPRISAVLRHRDTCSSLMSTVSSLTLISPVREFSRRSSKMRITRVESGTMPLDYRGGTNGECGPISIEKTTVTLRKGEKCTCWTNRTAEQIQDHSSSHDKTRCMNFHTTSACFAQRRRKRIHPHIYFRLIYSDTIM